MAADDRLTIGPFRFDARTGGLWRGDVEAAKLTPRAAAVLATLAGRAQDVVTKRELFDIVWRGLVVSDDALTTCIQELRGALGDDARSPRYIETRHRRGYRLMVPAVPASTDRAPQTPTLSPAADSAKLVGRISEMEELHRRFGLMLSGQRQLVFVTGEPGIGKSTLTATFTDGLARQQVRVAQGQCLDHHGMGEPYLPLIEALTRLAAAPDGAAVKNALATHAPSWLAQMPSLWTRSERSAMETRARATRERMLRELTQAIEAVAVDSPLVLKLEDIQWSDASTLDWLVHFARRPEPARLMVLATFRPADAAALAAGLPGITSELALHGRCHEIALNPLTLEAIEIYVTTRFGHDGRIAQPREVARMLLERTGGNPLFIVSIVNQLAQQDAAAATPGAIVAIPHDVRRFIERQIDELSEPDRALLTAASVIRREFATTAVAAALDTDIEHVETSCARLARQGVFIYRSGSTPWPDGTLTELCTFRHDLYRELLYEQLSATRRAQSHARVGARLEAAWATRPDTIAAEIAEHFERGNALARAIPHHQRAAEKALRRSANQEAIGHLRRALDAIGHIADETERNKAEVELQVAMGAAYMAMRGFGASEVLQAYGRAETLCDCLGERADIFPALWGQWLFRWARSEMDAASRLGHRLLALAAKSGSAALELQAHHAMWPTTFGRGEFAQTRSHAAAGLAIYDASVHRTMASSYGNHDAGLCARYFSALALAIEGDGQRARASIESTLATARGLDNPFSLALALFFSSAAMQILGDAKLAGALAEEGVQTATEHALALPKSWSLGVRGWSLAENGEHARGLAMLGEAIASLQMSQSTHFVTYLLGLLADARIKANLHAEALEAVEQGLALSLSGERFYSAELYRLHGALCAHPALARKRDAAVSFEKAIAIARQQGAETFERKARGDLETLEAGC